MDLSSKSREELEHELRAAQQTIELNRRARRRRTDAAPDDHAFERRDDGNGGGIEGGYKGMHVSIRGPLAIVAVLFGVVGGALIYVNHKGFAESTALLRQSIADHQDIVDSQDLLSCVVSLTAEERTRVRQQGTREAFQIMCPWMRVGPPR